MAAFTESALEKKLEDLNCSQQSIQTLSLWLIHHRKHNNAIVKVWYNELLKAKESRKLTFMYLANDVIQNSKRKGPEYGKEFEQILGKAFGHLGSLGAEEKTSKNILRLLQVWEDRGVYGTDVITELKKAYTTHVTNPAKSKEDIGALKRRIENNIKSENMKEKKSRNNHEDVKKGNNKHNKNNKNIKVLTNTSIKTEVGGKEEVHITLSPKIGIALGDPPEPEELIKALQELENSASADAMIRGKIASLPPEVSDITSLSKIEDRTNGDTLLKDVDEAWELLTAYNKRLQQEMEDRKNVGRMLLDFTQAQRDLVAQAEERLEEYHIKLEKVQQVRNELNAHLQNLPDLSKLPSVTGGLAPLPSAGDLFNIRA